LAAATVCFRGCWRNGGAAVVGYDRARQQIAQAQARVGAPGLDATFVVATPQTFFHDGTFDAAMSVMVLQFATSHEELAAFFCSASRHIGPGGRFISIVFNPLSRRDEPT